MELFLLFADIKFPYNDPKFHDSDSKILRCVIIKIHEHKAY